MKLIHNALLVSFVFFYACSPKEPEANLLVGSWNQVGAKSASDLEWRKTELSWGINVIFKRNGTVSTEKQMPFDGGWCNMAERYTLSDKTISLEYGKPNCIPFINPQVSSVAKIIDITAHNLTIDYNGYLLKFERR